jgi:hypothetical protein
MDGFTGRVTLRRVRLDAGGYDTTGRYWGRGAPLFRAECEETGDTWETRAQDRDHAVAMFERHFPHGKIIRHGYAGIYAGAPSGVCCGCGVLHG